MSTATEKTPRLDVEPPYVGLTYFTERYYDRFFGRDADSSVIVGNLCASRLTLLYAESGVGKSSLLRAGVAARISRQGLREQEAGRPPRFVVTVFSTWTQDPVAGLVRALGEALKPFTQKPIELPADLEHAFETVTSVLGTTLLVILDQFEEYFLYRSKTAGADTFADDLARCLARPELAVNFLISIREDMYAGLGGLFRGRIPNVYGNFLHLDYLDREAARGAIVGPIRVLQASHPEIEIEAELVEAVLDGVRLVRGAERANGKPATSPGQQADGGPERIETAYLQLVMRRLWDAEADAGSTMLRLETLQELGGTQEIIEGHLNRAMREFGATDQDTAASAFRFLVTRAGTKIAWTTKDLSEVADVDEARLGPVLRRLAEGDLKILRPVTVRDGGEGACYEIFHDALARPIVRWREEHAVERERKAKEEAQREAADATTRAATERRRRQIALAGLVTTVVALVAVVATFAIVERNQAAHHLRTAQSGEVAGRILAAGGPGFPPDAVALAGAEAARQLRPTFEARSATVGILQENAGMPRILAGHGRAVLGVAFGPPPATRVASASADGTVRIWDPRTGESVETFATSDGARLTSVAFSANGRVVAAGRGDGGIDLWHVEPILSHGRRSVPLFRTDDLSAACGDQDVRCTPVAFSPDGRTFAAGDNAGHVRLWDLQHIGKPSEVVRENGAVLSLAFSDDGRMLATAGEFGVHTWRLTHPGRIADRRDAGSRAPAYAVAWASSGALAAGTDARVERWRPDGRRLRPIEATATIYAVAFLNGGSRVAYGGSDEAVTVRDIRTRDVVGPPRSHGGEVYAIAVSADGSLLASGSDDTSVKLWPVDGAGALASTILGVPGQTNLAIGSSGETAAGNLLHGPVYVWTPFRRQKPAGEPRRTLLRGQEGPLAMSGDVLATTSVSSPASFVLSTVGRQCDRMPEAACRLRRLESTGHGDLYSMAFDSAGKLVATGSVDGWVTVWDVSDPLHVRSEGEARNPGTVEHLAFSPFDEALLATASDDGTVRLWRHEHGRLVLLAKRRGDLPVYALAFSPANAKERLLAAGGVSQTVSLWDVENPAEPRTILLPVAQTQSILSLAFSADGETLAAGDGRGSVCLYDVRSLRPIGSRRCLTGSASWAIDALVFDPSGRALLSSGRGQPVVAWNRLLWGAGTPSQVRDAVCRLARRNLTSAQWAYAFDGTKMARHWHATCRT